MLLPWKYIVSRISLVEPLFSFSIRLRLPWAGALGYDFVPVFVFTVHADVLTGAARKMPLLSSVFGLEKSPLGEFFIKICLARGRREGEELVWFHDPCKICHFNACNVLRMHRDFLGNFFPPATRSVFPVNSSEVLRRFVNSCGNIANASNGDGAKGGKWGREGESW